MKETQLIFFLGRADTAVAKAFKETRYLKVNIDKIGSHKVALDSFNKNASKEEKIEIKQIKYLNNPREQDNRFVKKRTKPTL